MSHAELVEWAAFHSIEPFGPMREDLRAGRIAATIANSAPFRTRGAELFDATDFFPELGAQDSEGIKKVQSKEEQIRNLKLWAIASRATVEQASNEQN